MSTRAVHDDDFRFHGARWACEDPERPPDVHTAFDERCYPCRLVAFASRDHADASVLVEWVDFENQPLPPITLREWSLMHPPGRGEELHDAD